jgi:hypothetical protein
MEKTPISPILIYARVTNYSWLSETVLLSGCRKLSVSDQQWQMVTLVPSTRGYLGRIVLTAPWSCDLLWLMQCEAAECSGLRVWFPVSVFQSSLALVDYHVEMEVQSWASMKNICPGISSRPLANFVLNYCDVGNVSYFRRWLPCLV